MSALLLDTHIWAWSLTGTPLPAAIGEGLAAAQTIYVSPISFYEIGQKVRLGKWPEMAPFVTQLPDLLREQGGLIASLTPDICLLAATMEWSHRDPFDRILAATSLINGYPLASVDTAFDTFNEQGRTVSRLG